MNLELSVHDDQSLLTVSGSVDIVDVPRLRDRIQSVLEEHRGDVLLDMRQALPVSDQLMSALTSARTLAKHLGRRLVVIDDIEGVTAGDLRRHGMHFRIPIYQDPADATAGLRADRDARERLQVFGRTVLPDTPPADTPPASGGTAAVLVVDEDDEGADSAPPAPAVQAGRTLWAAAGRRPPGSGVRR